MMIKVSRNLLKDKSVSVRINTRIFELLKEKDLSLQDIIDRYVNENFEIIVREIIKKGEEELELCLRCNGSGEGYVDGSKCAKCNGSGQEEAIDPDDIEYQEKEE